MAHFVSCKDPREGSQKSCEYFCRGLKDLVKNVGNNYFFDLPKKFLNFPETAPAGFMNSSWGTTKPSTICKLTYMIGQLFNLNDSNVYRATFSQDLTALRLVFLPYFIIRACRGGRGAWSGKNWALVYLFHNWQLVFKRGSVQLAS